MSNIESQGDRLKKIRQELGLSLEEVQKKTKIHLNILKAIEGDSLTGLSPVYLKGFLKIYCKFLGVDPKDYIPDYKETQTKVSPILANKDLSHKPAKFLGLFKTASVKLGFFKATFKKIKTSFIFILVTIFVVLGLFNLGKFISSRRKEQHLTPKKSSLAKLPKAESRKEQRLQKTSTVTITPKSQVKEALLQKEIPSVIRLGIRARENCWVSLKADGRVVFQRVLEKGRSETWQAKNKIELSLGNAGAVELEVNGQLFSNLGRKGQVLKNILITKEGLNIGR